MLFVQFQEEAKKDLARLQEVKRRREEAEQRKKEEEDGMWIVLSLGESVLASVYLTDGLIECVLVATAEREKTKKKAVAKDEGTIAPLLAKQHI